MTKLIGIDIDGVLSKYPECWVDFVNQRTSYRFDNFWMMKKLMTVEEYKKLKDEYRRSGFKRRLPLRGGAKEFLESLIDREYYIMFLTKRPIHEYPNLLFDTIFWIRSNDLPYDLLMWCDKRKHLRVIGDFPYVNFIVDDDKRICNDLGKYGYRTFLLDSPYNQGELHPNVTRVKTFEEILERIDKSDELL